MKRFLNLKLIQRKIPVHPHRSRLTSGLRLLLLFLLFPLFTQASADVPQEELSAKSVYYSFGVVPQQSASKLTKLWAPILHKIESQTGLRLILKTAPDIPEFERRLSKGEYDFAYMNPYHFTVFNKSPGYQAIAKAKDKKIHGIIVIHKDSPIASLPELYGKTLSFPAPAAFAASVLTRANLARMGIDFTPKYVQTHDSVYMTVAKGIYPAGGGVNRTLKSMPAEVRDHLKVLWTSPGYTPHAIASRSNLDEGVKMQVQKALLSLDHSNEGRTALSSLRLKGFEAAKNSDWDDVRGLGLDILH